MLIILDRSDVEVNRSFGGMAMLRQARLGAPGTPHHVIVRGIEKARIVNNRADRVTFVSCMGEIASETGKAIYAW